MIRIRFHGRGGQGMKTASRIVGTAASLKGYYVQDFPLFGAERRGAQVSAFTRISDKTILERGVINNPHIVIVSDDSLLEDPAADPLSGISDTSIIVINTQLSSEAMIKLRIRGHVVPFDATGISLSVTGSSTALSTAMGAAGCRVTGLIDNKALTEAVTKELASMGISSENVIKKNIEVALKCFDIIPSFEMYTSAEAFLSEAKTMTMQYEPPVISSPSILEAGQTTERQTGKWRTFRPVIHYDKCNNCWICFVWCPEGVISLDEKESPHIDYEHCKGCLICYEECPVKAITVERERPAMSKE